MKRRIPTKIYFAQFEAVYSMNVEDAIKLAQTGINGKSWDLLSYKSARRLKVRKSLRENSEIRIGRHYREIHSCLDWVVEDWKEFKAMTLNKHI